MAKENGQHKQEAPAAYFKSLTIEDVKCFKGKHTIDLSDGKGNPAQWTVILGNNNTGKTTLLKCLSGLGVIDNPLSGLSDPNIVFPSFTRLSKSPHAGNFFSLIFGSFSATLISEFFLKLRPSESIQKSDFQIFYGSNENHWGKKGQEAGVPASYFFEIGGAIIYSYGASRKMSTLALSESEEKTPHANLFDHQDLPNMEDWLLNLFLAEKLGRPEARLVLELAKKVLSSGLLPDVQEVNLNSREKGAGFVNFAEFRTDFGWIRLRDLGYGYQTMIAWVLDLVKRLVERYPQSANPLAEPAIVLVDEIDLHLHPDWQRKIIAHLTKYFPNTQFIVTAHSPLIVQSAEEVNLVILKKEGEAVYIEQPKIRSFRGWTVEEILTDLMDLAGQTMSETYLEWMNRFDDALQDDDYEAAEAAYRELDKILHHDSSSRTLLKLQMSSLSPDLVAA